MDKLKDKVAIITGATSGIGLHTAKLFLAEGAKVVLTGRSEEKIAALQQELEGDFLIVRADAASIADSKALIDQTVATFGNIDILFPNAGVFKLYPISELTEQHYDEIYNINVKGALFLVHAALPHLNDGASILFNSSVTSAKGFANTVVYGSGKAALRSMARILATELAPRGIRVNTIAPGPIETPIWERSNLSAEEREALLAGSVQSIPLGRMGQSEEVAQAALFLASDASAYITGVQLPIDGGLGQV